MRITKLLVGSHANLIGASKDLKRINYAQSRSRTAGNRAGAGVAEGTNPLNKAKRHHE